MIERTKQIIHHVLSCEWRSNPILMKQIKQLSIFISIVSIILLTAYMRIQNHVSVKKTEVSSRDFSQVTESEDVQALLIESMASKIQSLESQMKRLGPAEDESIQTNPYISAAEQSSIDQNQERLHHAVDYPVTSLSVNKTRKRIPDLKQGRLHNRYHQEEYNEPSYRTPVEGIAKNDRVSYIDSAVRNMPNAEVEGRNGEDASEIPTTANRVTADQTTSTKKESTVIPAGAFATAVLLGGVDAPASALNTANPLPVLLRVTGDAVLPNDTSVPLKGCFVTAAAIGDISSENVYIRLERLSCHRPDHDLIDTAVSGSVFGPNGKNGIRGNVVWREKSLIQRAFLAGGLSGISDLVKSQSSYTSPDTFFNRTAVPNEKALTFAAASGTGSAFDRLADYHIKRAEQYHPVVQVSAGTIVDIVFLKGFTLDSKHADESLNNEEVGDA